MPASLEGVVLLEEAAQHELEEIEEKLEVVLESLDRIEKLVASLLPTPVGTPGTAVSAVLNFISQ